MHLSVNYNVFVYDEHIVDCRDYVNFHMQICKSLLTHGMMTPNEENEQKKIRI